MKNLIKNTTLVTGLLLAVASHALAGQDCYVDYKAKQSSGGLKLHYGVMQLSGNACSNNATAQQVVAKRLANGGWTLLRIVSKFDQSGVSQRQANAGAYFLRY